MDTGEGGLAPYHLEGGCDIVFEIGTAKCGVRTPDGELDDAKLLAICAHKQVKMVSIKLVQGAKPGMGGLLPAGKVTPEIAEIRGIPVGKDSQSPNRHLDIGNIHQLLDKIAHIRELTGRPVGFKAVFGGMEWIEELCDEVRKRGIQSAPDFHHRRRLRRRHRRGAADADGRCGSTAERSPAGAAGRANRQGPARARQGDLLG